jgi:hypothetical protein
MDVSSAQIPSVCSSGHRRAVSGVMLVMHNVCASGKFGGCSKEPSQDKTSWDVCRGAELSRILTTEQ